MNGGSDVVILGIGSPFGADRLGWEVADLLRHSPVLARAGASTLAIYSLDRPGPALLNYLSNARVGVLVDAICSTVHPPSQILRLEESGIAHVLKGELSSHGVGVADTLALGRALGMLPDRVLLYGINVIDDIEQMPAAVLIERLATEIQEEVAAYLGLTLTANTSQGAWCSTPFAVEPNSNPKP